MTLTAALRVVVFGGLTALLAFGCATPGGHDTDAPSGRGAVSELPPLQLPDLSQMDPAVQRHIRDQAAAIARAAQPADTTASAVAHGAMGGLFLAAQDLGAAARYFERAQVLAPDDPRWPYALGHVAHTSGALDRAATAFERVLELKAGEAATRLRLGNVYLSQGLNDRAARLFEQVRIEQPQSAAALFGLGRAALANGAPAEAVRHLEQARAIDPRAAAIHYPLSLAYRELGDASKADEQLALRQDGAVSFPEPLLQQVTVQLESPATYESQGILALDAGDWKTAAEQFRKGLALAPQSPSLGQRLGTALFMMGDVGGAGRELRRVVTESPGYARAHYSLGLLLESEARMDEAMARFQEATRLEPTYVEARLRLASALSRSGRLTDALSQYGKALELDPRVAGARYAQAIALTRLRRYSEALDVLREGMRLHPEEESFALGLARVLAASPDGAVRNAAEARVLLDRLSDADRASDGGETIAMVLAELGIFDGAKAWQQRAIDAAAQRGGRAAIAGMNEMLARYQRAEPSRTPWREDELP